MAIRSFANGNEGRGKFAAEHAGKKKLEEALGAVAWDDGKGGTIGGSKQISAMIAVRDMEMSEDAKIDLIMSMYPQLEGLNENNLTDYTSVMAAKARGGQSSVVNNLKASSLSEEEKRALWEFAAGYTAKTYDSKMK